MFFIPLISLSSLSILFSVGIGSADIVSVAGDEVVVGVFEDAEVDVDTDGGCEDDERGKEAVVVVFVAQEKSKEGGGTSLQRKY